MSPARRVPNRLRSLHGLPTQITPTTTGVDAELTPPSWLPREAKKEWQRILDAVRAYPSWLQQADVAALTAYTMSWATYVAAAKDVARRGPLVPGRSSADAARGEEAALVKNPAVAVMRDAAVALRSWCTSLGFTPDARGKVDVGIEEETDKAERLLSDPMTPIQ